MKRFKHLWIIPAFTAAMAGAGILAGVSSGDTAADQKARGNSAVGAGSAPGGGQETAGNTVFVGAATAVTFSDTTTSAPLIIRGSHITLRGGVVAVSPRGPEGAVYHQVVDRYFDRDGNPIEVKSATPVVDPDCSPGRRGQANELIADIHDDGRGNVRFGSEKPATQVAEAR